MQFNTSLMAAFYDFKVMHQKIRFEINKYFVHLTLLNPLFMLHFTFKVKEQKILFYTLYYYLILAKSFIIVDRSYSNNYRSLWELKAA